MEFVAQLIRRIRLQLPVRARHVTGEKPAGRRPDFGPSTAGLADCSSHDSASKAQELLDAWMEEDRRRLLAHAAPPRQ